MLSDKINFFLKKKFMFVFMSDRYLAQRNYSHSLNFFINISPHKATSNFTTRNTFLHNAENDFTGESLLDCG